MYVYTSPALSNSDLTYWFSSFPQEYNVIFSLVKLHKGYEITGSP